MAWPAGMEPFPYNAGFEVLAADRHGGRVLDAGPNVDLRSLPLNGSTLTWRRGGALQSATLE